MNIIQNADLQEWIEIFFVFNIFAKSDEFTGLAEQPGQRLGFSSGLRKGSKGDEFSKNAALTYIAAGELEKWSTLGLRGCRKRCELCFGSGILGLMWFQFHRHVILCTCMHSRPSSRRSRPSILRWFEYADLLLTQGLVDKAVSYKGTASVKFTNDMARGRLLCTLAKSAGVASTLKFSQEVYFPHSICESFCTGWCAACVQDSKPAPQRQ